SLVVCFQVGSDLRQAAVDCDLTGGHEAAVRRREKGSRRPDLRRIAHALERLAEPKLASHPGIGEDDVEGSALGLCRRPKMKTKAPSSMKRFAAARPMPVALPVITAVFPFSLVMSCLITLVTIKVSISGKKIANRTCS